MRRFLSLDNLTAAPGQGDAFAVPGRLLGPPLEDRCIRYCFSDASVGRDMHTIAADAWDLTNFQRNPVFLWAHLDDELPVGRVENLATEAGRLVGQVRYAEHPFADTVYQLVKGDFLNATSTGWLPLEWRAAKDRARPGGLDFTRVELLEISQVPVPALPSALVTARSAGIDTRPLFDWAERLLDRHDFAVVGKADLEQLRKAAQMPKAKTEPAAREIPTLKFGKRGLWTVSWLAALMGDLGAIQESTAWEAAYEEDGSPIPDRLLEALKALGQILIDMTAEEVAELVARDGDGDDDAAIAADAERAGVSPVAMVRLMARGDFARLHGLAPMFEDLRRGRSVVVHTSEGPVPLVRKGAKYSAETLRCMRAIQDHLAQAHDQLSGMLDEADNSNPEDDDNNPGVDAEDDNSRALRAARAAALKAKHAA